MRHFYPGIYLGWVALAAAHDHDLTTDTAGEDELAPEPAELLAPERRLSTISNPGFETGYSGSGYSYQGVTGWSSGGGTVYVRSCNGAWGGTCAAEGSYYMSLQSSSTFVAQTFPLAAGGYTLNVYLAHRPNYGGSCTVTLTLGGVAVASSSPGLGGHFSLKTWSFRQVELATARVLALGGAVRIDDFTALLGPMPRSFFFLPL